MVGDSVISAELAVIYLLQRKRKMQLLEARKPDRARAKINHLIRTGELKRPLICERCGNPGDIRAHHEDYNKPLEVIWLCNPCHSKLVTPNHKSSVRFGTPGNRPKTERNQKIMEYSVKGYRQQSIANMFKMKVSAVSMVILRETRKLESV